MGSVNNIIVATGSEHYRACRYCHPDLISGNARFQTNDTNIIVEYILDNFVYLPCVRRRGNIHNDISI